MLPTQDIVALLDHEHAILHKDDVCLTIAGVINYSIRYEVATPVPIQIVHQLLEFWRLYQNDCPPMQSVPAFFKACAKIVEEWRCTHTQYEYVHALQEAALLASHFTPCNHLTAAPESKPVKSGKQWKKGDLLSELPQTRLFLDELEFATDINTILVRKHWSAEQILVLLKHTYSIAELAAMLALRDSHFQTYEDVMNAYYILEKAKSVQTFDWQDVGRGERWCYRLMLTQTPIMGFTPYCRCKKAGQKVAIVARSRLFRRSPAM